MYGVEAIVGKLTSKHAVKNPWLFNFIWSFFVTLFILPFALANHVGFPKEWTNLLLATLFYGLSNIIYVLAIYLLDISVLSPLFNFRTVFSVFLSAWLLGQILTGGQYLLIAVIFVAGFFVSLDEHYSIKSFFTWAIAIAMLEMLDLAFMGVYINKAVAVNGYWETTLWIAVISQVSYLFTIPLFFKDFKKTRVKQVGSLIFMAGAGMVGTIAANKSYTGNVPISAAIISLPFSLVMAFLFAVFAPKILEKHTLKVYAIRFAAAAVMFAAALKLSG